MQDNWLEKLCYERVHNPQQNPQYTCQLGEAFRWEKLKSWIELVKHHDDVMICFCGTVKKMIQGRKYFSESRLKNRGERILDLIRALMDEFSFSTQEHCNIFIDFLCFLMFKFLCSGAKTVASSQQTLIAFFKCDSVKGQAPRFLHHLLIYFQQRSFEFRTYHLVFQSVITHQLLSVGSNLTNLMLLIECIELYTAGLDLEDAYLEANIRQWSHWTFLLIKNSYMFKLTPSQGMLLINSIRTLLEQCGVVDNIEYQEQIFKYIQGHIQNCTQVGSSQVEINALLKLMIDALEKLELLESKEFLFGYFEEIFVFVCKVLTECQLDVSFGASSCISLVSTLLLRLERIYTLSKSVFFQDKRTFDVGKVIRESHVAMKNKLLENYEMPFGSIFQNRSVMRIAMAPVSKVLLFREPKVCITYFLQLLRQHPTLLMASLCDLLIENANIQISLRAEFYYQYFKEKDLIHDPLIQVFIIEAFWFQIMENFEEDGQENDIIQEIRKNQNMKLEDLIIDGLQTITTCLEEKKNLQVIDYSLRTLEDLAESISNRYQLVAKSPSNSFEVNQLVQFFEVIYDTLESIKIDSSNFQQIKSFYHVGGIVLNNYQIGAVYSMYDGIKKNYGTYSVANEAEQKLAYISAITGLLKGLFHGSCAQVVVEMVLQDSKFLRTNEHIFHDEYLQVFIPFIHEVLLIYDEAEIHNSLGPSIQFLFHELLSMLLPNSIRVLSLQKKTIEIYKNYTSICQLGPLLPLPSSLPKSKESEQLIEEYFNRLSQVESLNSLEPLIFNINHKIDIEKLMLLLDEKNQRQELLNEELEQIICKCLSHQKLQHYRHLLSKSY